MKPLGELGPLIFSRTSALADLRVPIRAGGDLGFLGGLVRHVIETERFFRRELLEGRVPLSTSILFVSGRTSFEILQKAVAAGVPIVAEGITHTGCR